MFGELPNGSVQEVKLAAWETGEKRPGWKTVYTSGGTRTDEFTQRKCEKKEQQGSQRTKYFKGGRRQRRPKLKHRVI